MGKTTRKYIKTVTQKKNLKMNADLEKNTQKSKYFFQCVFKSLCKEEPSNAQLMWTIAQKSALIDGAANLYSTYEFTEFVLSSES